jgi:hypothetical protein
MFFLSTIIVFVQAWTVPGTLLQNLSTDSLTDSQKARIEERPSETGREQVAQEGASKVASHHKRGPAALDRNDAQNNNEEVGGH